MAFVNFGMSFVLKGLHNPKLAKQLAKRALLDGVFQIHLENRQFIWIVKTEVIHCVSFSDLYDARGNLENKYILEMLFNGTFPCELHAQSEAEREIVHRILQSVIQKAEPTLEDHLADKSVHKQATVKKKGKVMASKRVLVLNTWRHCISVFYNENYNQAAPSYHILLHHKVSINPRKKKSLQIVGTYKNLWVAFKTPGERDSWLSELKSIQLPAPIQQIIYEPPSFEPMVKYAADPKKRQYITAPLPSLARAGPSPY